MRTAVFIPLLIAWVFFFGFLTRGTIAYYYYYPHPSVARSPTMLATTSSSPFGFVTDVPFDPNDSFTNYDWEPSEEDSEVSPADPDASPNYTYHDVSARPLRPPITRGAAGNAMLTRIPILPYDYNAVYMDGNEDSFDGMSNDRWNRPARELTPPHISLTGSNRPNDESLFPTSTYSERTNVPFGRRLGFDFLPTWLDTPAMETANRERYVNVDLGNYLLTRSSLFNPPHYPGLQ